MDFDGLLDDRSPNIDELTLNQSIRGYLDESAGWGKFLAIVGFVFMGLGIIIIFGFGGYMASISPLGAGATTSLVLWYVFIFAILLYPIYQLYNFSTKAKQALATEEQSLLENAFSSHKSMFKFYGILMIINLGLMALGILIAIFGLLQAGF